MPTERLSMRHIREVVRLHYSVGMSQRAVSRSLGLAQGTVSKYINRTRRAGLTWPLPPELDDDVRLENRLYPPPSDLPSDERPQPDWAVIHRELRRAGVTLMLLWEEYCDASSDSFSYSWFCERYKEWAGRLRPTLRQVHVAGEKLFVDYSGHTLEVIDGASGEVRTAQIFVAVLGASNYTYAEASFSQSLPDWIASHVRAFSYFGGSARQTVSDNLKAGITRACFHEPMVNRTYADLARHYRTAVVPARPYHPRDKAKVEVGVQIVGRWILARLRNRRFFSLAALNEAIHALLFDLNDRPLRSWGRTRRELFKELERPALTPLPDDPYEYAECPTTIPEHMPSSHRRYRDWTHERIRCEAAKVGPDADTLIEVILRSRPHPEQGFRSAIGILGLVKRYGQERVDAACARALLLNARSYRSVAAILKNGTDKTASPIQEAPILFHANIRGRGYYN